jgi:alpha-L-fucosidase
MPVKPSAAQLGWQAAEFGMFCHFGINTFYGKEWSDGSLDPAGFNPRRLDPRQWVTTAQAAGMRYMILTAKHHDGFCLWQTDTTDYSVAASPYKNGKGDVVAELAEACRELGMPLGLYLSPWDRHEPCYPDAAAYDRFYIQQLTELCTRYGPLFEIWFDGAGSEGRTYNWDAIMEVVQRYQPDAMVFNMGRPTIRWIGNEDGLADDPNYYTQPTLSISAFTDRHAALTEPVYLPPECDVSIRRGWFWHPDEEPTLKSLEHLLGIYYRSVGLGANLLLNVPPDRDGLIAEPDQARLLELAVELKQRFASPIPCRLEQDGATVWAIFDDPSEFDHLVLCELLDEGQRVDGYTIIAEPAGAEIARGGTLGVKRIHAFPTVRTARLRIGLNTPAARLQRVIAYRTGHTRLPTLGPLLNYDELAPRID